MYADDCILLVVFILEKKTFSVQIKLWAKTLDNLPKKYE